MKIKQSETVIIKRSQINFAPYNPRKKDKKVVESLKENFKRVGFLGGIQYNLTTHNLIGGHKRLEALDLIHNYNGKNGIDYDVKVEQIEIDEKTEKEQNIYLNNKRHQGETDFEMMATLLNEIDIDNAGLSQIDIDIVESVVPDFEFGNNSEILNDIEDVKQKAKTQEEINHVKNTKKLYNNNTGENHLQKHFTVTFSTYDEKAEFLEGIGINGDDIFITSKVFVNKINER